MTPEEIDMNLDELENRLERLRALYEQYFLGIEKIEPQIPRKDVDRRFWMLRKIQIRNTARRFRLQVLVQRYNTFQQYWARVCREIENGTYKRHLIKAEKQFGTEALTHAARKRGRRRSASEPPGEEDRPSGVSSAEDELGALLGSNIDFGEEMRRAEAAAVTVPVAPAPAVRPTPPKRLDIGDLDLDLDGFEGPGSAPRPPAAAPAHGANPPAAAAPSPADWRAPKPPLPLPRAAKPHGPPLPGGAAPSAPRPALPGPVGAVNPQTPALDRRATPPRPPGPARPHTVDQGLSEDRVRQLHAELVAAKKQLNQGGAVSVDSLAKSLRETADRLQTKHKGSRIDFQIVVKDGQAVVRPVVRK